MNDIVGIVIVSHSKDIAKGTADMVRQMVGCEIKVALCGGKSRRRPWHQRVFDH